MKQYALVKIGTDEPKYDRGAYYFDYVEDVVEFCETVEQAKEAFDEAVDFGPISKGEYSKETRCTFFESVNYYVVEFEGEENPDEEYYIDFASGKFDQYVDELDEEDKPKGDFKILYSSDEIAGFEDFKTTFDRKKGYYYNNTLEHAIEFYQAHHLFDELIMNNIDNSTDELDASRIDYESCPSDYHFCDFVNDKGEIIAEKLEAVKAEQGRD